jgi:prophage maintenance system killer protein
VTDREDARWPSFDEVVGILHELATGLFGSAENPYPAFEVLDRNLIESAIGLPHQPYYETFPERLAAMVRSLAANHGLRDGNKRLALTVLHSTLLVNGYVYTWNDDEAEALVLRCAGGDSDFQWLAEFIEIWASPDEAEGHDIAFEHSDALRGRIEELRASKAAELSDGSLAGWVALAINGAVHVAIQMQIDGQLPREAIDYLQSLARSLRENGTA